MIKIIYIQFPHNKLFFANEFYLEALGKPATALVIRDARIGEANCTRDSDIATAQANEEKDKAVYASNRAIENQTDSFKLLLV